VAEPEAVPGVAAGFGLELSVLHWFTAHSVGSGSWISSAPEGKMLVVVNVRIKNVSRSPSITMNPLYCVLKDAAGNNYGKDMLALGLTTRLKLTELAPGQSVEGKVLFVVPKDATMVEFRYTGGPLAVKLP
jgi:hypothetical protein